MTSEPLILEAGRADRQYWWDLWRYRELLLFLAWRDISVHYKQTLIGASWALVRPLVTVLILTLVFSKVAKLEADGGIWYPLFVLGGMLPWQFFSVFLAESANSLVSNANLVSKVYFPRMIVPLSSLGVPLVDLAILLPVLGVLFVIGGVVPPWQVVLAPVFLVLAGLTAFGLGLFLCAWNVRFRDVRYIIPFIMQFGVYVTPIGYSSRLIPDEYQILFHLNPMVFVIDGLRWCLLGVGDPFAGGGWLVSLAVMACGVLLGVRTFRRTEKTFSDVI